MRGVRRSSTRTSVGGGWTLRGWCVGVGRGRVLRLVVPWGLGRCRSQHLTLRHRHVVFRQVTVARAEDAQEWGLNSGRALDHAGKSTKHAQGIRQPFGLDHWRGQASARRGGRSVQNTLAIQSLATARSSGLSVCLATRRKYSSASPLGLESLARRPGRSSTTVTFRQKARRPLGPGRPRNRAR